MAVSSKQFVRARISRAKFRQLLKLFALDLTATQITALTSLNRNTVNRYLTLIRQAIAEHCQRESPFSGEVELDDSYFGARRVRGKRGRGARGKTIVFGIYKRNGRVYTQIIPNCRKSSIQAIIRGKFAAKLIWLRPSIRTAFVPMTASYTWATGSITASSMAKTSLSEARLISMASKASGGWQRPGSLSSKGCAVQLFICT
jgi:hypothetical protein